MTRNQFLKTPEMTQYRKQINSCAVCCYICAGISLVAGLLLFGSASVLIDVILVVVCGVLIQTLQSRAAAIVLACYSLINVIMGVVINGRPQGWWLCFIAVYSIIYTFKFQKAWKEFKNSPDAEIYG